MLEDDVIEKDETASKMNLIEITEPKVIIAREVAKGKKKRCCSNCHHTGHT